MATQAEVITTRKAPARLWQSLARAVLMVLAFVLLWAGARAFWNWEMSGAATFAFPWGGWLWCIALFVLAGVAFGLAAMLPERVRYRPARVLLLGIVPLLMLVDLTVQSGPAMEFTMRHFHFLLHGLFFFDSGPGAFAVPVMLGVAIAAGFAPGD